MQEKFDLSKDGPEKWLKILQITSPFQAAYPVEINEEMIEKVQADVEASPVPLLVPELETPYHPGVNAACCKALAAEGRIVELSRPRGRYCSHKVFRSLNQQQIFTARQ